MNRHTFKKGVEVRPATPVEISAARKNLYNPYAFLDDNGDLSATATVVASATVATNTQAMYAELNQILGWLRQKQSDAELEDNINALLNWGWKYRHIIWSDAPQSPEELLDPYRFLDLLGYHIQSESSLGSLIHRGNETETAAIIDVNAKLVRYSNSPSINPRSMRFTLAHELGHACRHNTAGMPLHRDVPLDAPEAGRSKLELEADKFASLFCMPKKLVLAEVKSVFGSKRIELDDLTIFRLGENSMREFTEFARFDDKRMALAKTIAKAGSFDGKAICSLAEKFDVSIKAMARRLIELKVV